MFNAPAIKQKLQLTQQPISFIAFGMCEFESFLQQKTQAVEALLNEILCLAPREGEITRPQYLIQAMRHGVLDGGKRIRPFLVLEVASLFNAPPQAALQLAASLELLHGYSLIHDDLPAMDDDDLRRGRPTVHKKFDEATAILAGDALLTLAFELLADLPMVEPAISLRLVGALARASGLAGMVGGQMLDLRAQNQQNNEQAIITLQTMKTGALIRYACEAGAILGQAKEEHIRHMAQFGYLIGRAFQLTDDLLDITADTQTLGKTAGKDVKAGKATLVALKGTDWAQCEVENLIKQADDLLSPFGKRADRLRQMALFVIRRRN